MRKSELRQKVIDQALEAFHLQSDIAVLNRKLDEKRCAMHDCPICGLRHHKGPPEDDDDAWGEDEWDALDSLLRTTDAEWLNYQGGSDRDVLHQALARFQVRTGLGQTWRAEPVPITPD